MGGGRNACNVWCGWICRCRLQWLCHLMRCTHAAVGDLPDMAALLAPFGDAPLLSVRPSSQDPDWGGPSAILNVGMNDARHAELIKHGAKRPRRVLYLRFVQSYAIHVARLDPDEFHFPMWPTLRSLKAMLATYEFETDEAFPQDACSAAGRSAALDGAGLGWNHRASAAASKGRARRCGAWLGGAGDGAWAQGGANADQA